MADLVVVDASVVLKAFVDEPGSPQALTLFESDVLLLAPAHLLAEVAEVLVRKLRTVQITESQLHSALLVLPGSVVVVQHHQILLEGVSIARERGHSVYDCLYVASAQLHGCKLVTADDKLVRKARSSRFVDDVVPLAAYTQRT